MAIDRDSSSVITLDEAKYFTKGYQAAYPSNPKAFFSGSDKLRLILQQENCIGIRIYNGFDEGKQVMNLVLIGVDERGVDIIDGVILERLVPCPSDCDATSPLN